jgi:hypothetical protein
MLAQDERDALYGYLTILNLVALQSDNSVRFGG